MIETGSHDLAAGDEALSQAMLQILERVAGPNTRAGGHGSVMERLQYNGIEIFRGVAGVSPNVAEYWIEATERIMDDLDCTPEQKLKDVVSLLRDEAYQWWLTIKKGTQPERLSWEYFNTSFQGKYVGSSYVDVGRREFLNLTQGDRLMAEVLIAPQRKRDFAALVEKEKIAEKVKCAEWQNRERSRNKRESEPLSFIQRPKKKARVDRLIRFGAPIVATG
ncbi:uncharacterized protein [Gossypium hirsutum]|uniref:Retrotransposon gag domain-containing protein n=1 Tax=Gossypium hirsutum TaxID=3635 RepID=A0ABM2ZQ18_GOSHI|nr:uncharacterized protein LOC121214703 [Gossypium hirsutum]